ncbi:hypothetical protein OO015_13685 (plasmid) [Thermomicrobium sp. 4228-Ro]|uniref:hypothetical protein n=1 Tax=Thermomicrobium sp. 4228-Ro TaxID=2993937 RepID=UPI0022494E41|nr:hypothetical protein [Thermomicrobium sp. 4228-Ro]MCX2728536.1 hypothetical protein [Thermomicrobium sp. 4228-Ro]
MVTWIESHTSLRHHWKLDLLCSRLEISRPAAIGHLHLLWWWVITYAESGDLSRFPRTVLASAAEWVGDPHQFVDALVEAGFLDEDEHGLRVHGWTEYCGRLISERERRRRWRSRQRTLEEGNELRAQNQIERPNGPVTSRGRTTDVSETAPSRDRGVPETNVARDGDVTETSPSRERDVPVTSYRTNRTKPTEPNRSTPTPQSPPPPGSGTPEVADVVDADRLAELWNTTVAVRGSPFPPVAGLTRARRQRIALLLRELHREIGPHARSVAFWTDIFARLQASPFLRGESASGWVAHFDWLVESAQHVVRVLEGRYDETHTPVRSSPNGTRARASPNGTVTPERLAELERMFTADLDLPPSELLRREREAIRARKQAGES